MEFKIYNPQEEGFLKEIDWNYEELKTEIQGKANDYMNLVYTADQVKDAKKDLSLIHISEPTRRS